MSNLSVEDNQIKDMFSEIKSALSDKTTRKVIRAGNTVVKSVLKTNTPYRNGINEKHHIVDDLTSRTFKENGQVVGLTYYKGDNTKSFDDGTTGNKGFIARFINDGFYHTNKNTDGTKAGRSLGEYIPGKHFVESSANEADGPATEAMASKFDEVISDDR